MPDDTTHASVDTVVRHADARGVVIEPLGPDLLPEQRNVHVVTTAPGAVRGNHHHERGTEVAVVLGPARVRLREGTAVRDVVVPRGEAYRFTIPPGVGHAFENTGPEAMVLVAFNTAAHDPSRPDVVRENLIPTG